MPSTTVTAAHQASALTKRAVCRPNACKGPNAEVPIPDAVAATGPLAGNRVFQQALGEAGRRLVEGGSLATGPAALRPYAPSTFDLIAGGEQMNRLGRLPTDAAEMHETRTRRRIERLLAPLTPHGDDSRRRPRRLGDGHDPRRRTVGAVTGRAASGKPRPS